MLSKKIFIIYIFIMSFHVFANKDKEYKIIFEDPQTGEEISYSLSSEDVECLSPNLRSYLNENSSSSSSSPHILQINFRDYRNTPRTYYTYLNELRLFVEQKEWVAIIDTIDAISSPSTSSHSSNSSPNETENMETSNENKEKQEVRNTKEKRKREERVTQSTQNKKKRKQDHLFDDDERNQNIFDAARNGDIETIRLFFETKRNSEETLINEEDETLLHIAVRHDQYELAELIIERDRRLLEEINNEGYTPIHIAVRHGHYETFLMLYEAGANIHTIDYFNNNLLVTASMYGHTEIVRFLLENGLSIESGSREERIADFLQEDNDPANIESGDPRLIHRYYTPLHTAVRYGHLNLVKYLIHTWGADTGTTDVDHYTLLHTAARYGHLEIARELIKGGVDLDATVEDFHPNRSIMPDLAITPLSLAAKYGQLALVKMLFEAQQDEAQQDEDEAQQDEDEAQQDEDEAQQDEDEAQQDEDEDEDENLRSLTPIQLAAREGHIDIVDFFINEGAPLEDPNEHYDDFDGIEDLSLLGLAAKSQHWDLVFHLLDTHEADPALWRNSHGTYGRMRKAITAGRLDIIKLLIDRHPEEFDFNATPNNSSSSLLSIALSYGNKDIVEYLLSKGANIASLLEDEQQTTPLEIAMHILKLSIRGENPENLLTFLFEELEIENKKLLAYFDIINIQKNELEKIKDFFNDLLHFEGLHANGMNLEVLYLLLFELIGCSEESLNLLKDETKIFLLKKIVSFKFRDDFNRPSFLRHLIISYLRAENTGGYSIRNYQDTLLSTARRIINIINIKDVISSAGSPIDFEFWTHTLSEESLLLDYLPDTSLLLTLSLLFGLKYNNKSL